MVELIYWIVVMSIVAGLALAAIVGVRAYVNGTSPSELLFKPRADPRIGVIEYANVDGRRKLLLIRRDDVEHLIMTGGPVDVVIETGIGESKPARASEAPVAATVFTRSSRAFSTATSAAGDGSAS
jgi:hypothetical protein